MLSNLIVIVALLMLGLYTIVTAYILVFSKSGSGINFDYILFVLLVIITSVFGGVF